MIDLALFSLLLFYHFLVKLATTIFVLNVAVWLFSIFNPKYDKVGHIII